eukprot:1193999-Prorocentrum_minimum.AAC.1
MASPLAFKQLRIHETTGVPEHHLLRYLVNLRSGTRRVPLCAVSAESGARSDLNVCSVPPQPVDTP